MVDRDAVTIALVVAGAVLLLLVTGQIMRLVSRMVMWATIPVLAVLIGYAVYELASGWNAAAETDRGRAAVTDTEPPHSVESVQEQYAEGDISEAELDRELEDLVEEELETERN